MAAEVGPVGRSASLAPAFQDSATTRTKESTGLVSTFLRQVEFSQRGHRYAAATDAPRTYLARRSTSVAPYLLMPVIGDLGAIGTTYRERTSVLRDVMSLAGTVGVINSALLALGMGSPPAAFDPGYRSPSSERGCALSDPMRIGSDSARHGYWCRVPTWIALNCESTTPAKSGVSPSANRQARLISVVGSVSTAPAVRVNGVKLCGNS
ncbi:hypothetical protein [Catellatospora tritici]|uniref:hypothetical protein n=1 Tax=Catellatospora tritici TaxID=2851566 RepID=UPI001C2CF7F1|nr:hypothetical protein [Catellatospora tritici]MBV1853973.1 hypothetical protein [Catellatospora tritici]